MRIFNFNWELICVFQMADLFALSKDDKAELFCLIESALQVVTLSEVPDLQQKIADRIKFGKKIINWKIDILIGDVAWLSMRQPSTK